MKRFMALTMIFMLVASAAAVASPQACGMMSVPALVVPAAMDCCGMDACGHCEMSSQSAPTSQAEAWTLSSAIPSFDAEKVQALDEPASMHSHEKVETEPPTGSTQKLYDLYSDYRI